MNSFKSVLEKEFAISGSSVVDHLNTYTEVKGSNPAATRHQGPYSQHLIFFITYDRAPLS